MFQGTVLAPPFFLFCSIILNFDPIYFMSEEILLKFTNMKLRQHSILVQLLILCIRQSITLIGVCLPLQALAFTFIIDMCRTEMYDFSLTTMLAVAETGTSSATFHSLHRSFVKLRLCHNVFTEYFQHFYICYITFTQISVVGFLWMSITHINRVPFIVWFAFPIYAVQVGFGAFLYLSMSCCAHSLSDSFLQICMKRRRQLQISVQEKMIWKSTRSLKIRCGSFFRINKPNLLFSFHLSMNNLATLLLLRLKY